MYLTHYQKRLGQEWERLVKTRPNSIRGTIRKAQTAFLESELRRDALSVPSPQTFCLCGKALNRAGLIGHADAA